MLIPSALLLIALNSYCANLTVVVIVIGTSAPRLSALGDPERGLTPPPTPQSTSQHQAMALCPKTLGHHSLGSEVLICTPEPVRTSLPVFSDLLIRHTLAPSRQGGYFPAFAHAQKLLHRDGWHFSRY